MQVSGQNPFTFQGIYQVVTIKKGESVTLFNDILTPHVIANGAWEQGTARPAREAGAPEVKHVQINGTSSAIVDPFPTACTFKLYYTIHLA